MRPADPAVTTPTGVCVFDLDRTLVAERTVIHLADVFGVRSEVDRIWDEHHRDQEVAAGDVESRRIAALFTGVSVARFEAACAEVPFRDGAHDAVLGLRRQGYVVGVVSAGYAFATRRAQRTLGLDFERGVELETEDGVLTGRIVGAGVPGPCGQYICKANTLALATKRHDASRTIAVGDGRNDVCMLEAADFGAAVTPCHPRLEAVADVVLADLGDLPRYVADAFSS